MSRPSSSAKSGRKTPYQRNLTRLQLEALEDRTVPSGNTISGFVYHDLNNNGIYDLGETPIANSQIKLYNSFNQVVGTTITNAQGFYSFDRDQLTPYVDATLTKTVTFPTTQTNFQLSGLLDQFNPALGQLVGVEIQHQGSITSEIKVENLSDTSGSTISGTVAGTMTLVAPGVNNSLAISGYAGSMQVNAFDGILDFNGDSGGSFGQQSASDSNTFMVAGSALSSYIGTGKVTVTEKAVAGSSATDSSGNIGTKISSKAQATITVIYHYKAYGPLRPGNYVIVQPNEPAGYTDGKDAKNGVPIPNSIGTDVIPVTLVNTDVPNNNFGELKPASVSGFVYYDANNNHVRDAADLPIANVMMTLDGPGGPQFAMTNSSGFYQFTNLLPGAYSIAETQPAGYINGTDSAGTSGGTVVVNAGGEQITNITLNSGVNAQNYNFGELKPSSLAGYVYFDKFKNGVRDLADPAIAGAIVTINGPSGQRSTTTDASGHYQFDNLIPGVYTVTETQPAGYFDGSNTVGTSGGIVVVTASASSAGGGIGGQIASIGLPTGINAINYNFGELKTSSLSGKVYYDADNSGQYNLGDTPIAGTIVTLTGFADNGPVSRTTTTASDGSYSFTNLRPGTYAITETQPAGYQNGATNVGSQGGTPSTNIISDINLAAGVDGTNNNFGEVKLASLAGYVYFDANNNGVRDTGELPIAGVSMTLNGPSGQKVTTTDATGRYQFNTLPPGTYTVTETQPAGYLNGKNAVGSAGGALFNSASGEQIVNIGLSAGVNGINYNFGELKPASLSGRVYYDANNNGHYDAGEAPLPGTTISLTGVADSGSVSKTTTTASDGTYAFTNLRPGTYAITETQPAGYINGSTTLGSQGGTASTNLVSNINLAAGVNGINNNFGEIRPDVPDQPNNPPVPPLQAQAMPIISKVQLEGTDGSQYLPVALRNQMAFIVTTTNTLLGYVPTATQVLAGVAQLNAGMTRDSFIQQMWISDAHRTLQVKSLYQSLLNRPPTALELTTGVNSLKAGASIVTVEASIFASPAYQQLHPTATGLVTGLYQDILNITPGTAKTQSLLQSMDALPLSTVVATMLNSDASLANLIDTTYRETLHRVATAAEIQTWTNQIKTGAITLEALAVKLLASAEYYQLAFSVVK